MSNAIKPLGDRVVAVREKTSNKTASGLYLPEGSKEKPVVAIVEAVGPDVKTLKKGDRIIFEEYKTTDIKINGEDYLIGKLEYVLATL